MGGEFALDPFNIRRGEIDFIDRDDQRTSGVANQIERFTVRIGKARAPVEQHPSIGCAIKWRKAPSSKEWA